MFYGGWTLVERRICRCLIEEKCEKFTRGKFGFNFTRGFSDMTYDITRTHTEHFSVRKQRWMCEIVQHWEEIEFAFHLITFSYSVCML